MEELKISDWPSETVYTYLRNPNGARIVNAMKEASALSEKQAGDELGELLRWVLVAFYKRS